MSAGFDARSVSLKSIFEPWRVMNVARVPGMRKMPCWTEIVPWIRGSRGVLRIAASPVSSIDGATLFATENFATCSVRSRSAFASCG